MTTLVLILICILPLSAPTLNNEQNFHPTTLDKHLKILNIMTTIRHIESSDNYQARGTSGEYGAYQYMPGVWNFWSIELFGEVLDQTIPEVQDYVTYCRIERYLDEGYNYHQVASLWNSQSPEWEGKIGINRWGVRYDVPKYVEKFINHFNNEI